MKAILTDGFEFFTSSWPLDKTKPTLLFIHGAASSGEFWRYQVEGLTHTANCMAINLPGRGETDRAACDSISGYGDYILEFIKQNRIEQPVICGLSMGGAIVLDLLARGGNGFSAGITINTGARLRVHEMIFDAVRKDFKEFQQLFVQFGVSPHCDPKVIRRPLQQSAISSPDTALKDFTACNSFDIMDKLEAISVPVLVLSASDDTLSPVKYGEYLAQNIKETRTLCIEQAGHLSPVEKPEEINRAIGDFISQISQ